MKIKYIYILLLFILVPKISNGMEIITDKVDYHVGDQAVVLVKLDDTLNLGDEYILFAKFNNLNTKVYRLSDIIFGVVIPNLSFGSSTLEFNAYTRNIEVASQLEREIHGLYLQKLKLERRKSEELDAEKKSDLQVAIETYDQSILAKKSILENGRIFHSSMTKNISIGTAIQSITSLDLEVYPSANIPWGDFGSIQLYYPFEDEDEIKLEAYLDNTPVAMEYETLAGVWSYSFVAQYADRGNHNFSIKIFGQNLTRANIFKEAMRQTTHRRLELSVIRDVTISPSLRDFYTMEINDINFILEALVSTVRDTEYLVAEGSANFNIVPPVELLSISKTSETITEGNESFYTLRLRQPPSGQSFVTISSDDSNIKIWVDGKSPSNLLVLMFDEENWEDYIRVKFKVDDNGLLDGERLRTISHSISGGGFNPGALPELKVSIRDKVAPLVCNPDGLWIDPWSTVWLEVSLPKEPTGPVTVNFSETSGYLSLGDSLHFDANNWNIPQSLQIDSFENIFGRYTLEASSEGDSSIGGCTVELDLQGEY